MIRLCAHCGGPALGAASLMVHDHQVWLCHPDSPDALDCYSLVTQGAPLLTPHLAELRNWLDKSAEPLLDLKEA